MEPIRRIMIAAVLCLVPWSAELGAQQPGDRPAGATGRYVLFEVSGPMLETLPQLYLLETPADTLHDLLRRMRQARQDESIQGIILRIEAPSIGWGKAQALRSAIHRVRSDDKHVVCIMNSSTNLGYYVACAGDRIVLSPQAQLLVSGLRAEAVFARGLLDKLGVQAQIVQAGKYKGAAEGLTRSEPSDAFAEAMDSLVSDYFEKFVTDVAASRELAAARVRQLLGQGPFTAARAMEAGLVDDVLHYDQLVASLSEEAETSVETDYARSRQKAGGGVSLWSMLMGGGAGGRPTHQGPAIAVLYAVGPIILGGDAGAALGDEVVDAAVMRRTIRELASDQSIVGVVLRVDSPGGSALASDLVWRELRLLDRVKPVVASFSDTAASGGYYIGAGARRIVAEPGTLTGSIGVFGGKLVMHDLFQKLGLNVAVFEAGQGGGLYSSFEPLGPEGRKKFQRLIDNTYDIFLQRVATTRPDMDIDAVHRVAQGRIWTGRQAAERGLVDELGDLQAAIRRVKAEAGLDPGAALEIVRVPRSRHFIKALMSGAQTSTQGSPLARLPRGVRELAFLRQYLRAVLALRRDSAVCLMPAAVRVR